MRFFIKVCKYQPLPVFIKYILFAFRFKNKSAVPFGRLEQKVYLGIMPQRLKMPYALNSICYGFFVYNASL